VVERIPRNATEHRRSHAKEVAESGCDKSHRQATHSQQLLKWDPHAKDGLRDEPAESRRTRSTVMELSITAGEDVGFATGLVRCAGKEANGERTELGVRLTVCRRKIGGKWTVLHEHHSVPAS
jgi:hypothetical protein